MVKPEVNSLSRTVVIMLVLTLTGLQQTQAQASSATINFQVWDFWTADALPAAVVLLIGPATFNQTTNQAGNATVSLPFGNYTITVSKTQCSQIGPQQFTVDQTAPSDIIAKLKCPIAGSPALVNPHVQTDRPDYEIGQIISWTATGFAPGAYVQPCLADMCGAVVQSDRSGVSEGKIVVHARVPAGNQTLSVMDITSGDSVQIQIAILA